MDKKKILMIGPLDTQGGMSTVMKNYINSELLNKIVDIEYISSAADGSKIKKIYVMYKGLIKLITKLIFYNKEIDIVHVHVALNGSIYRKGLFIKIAKKFNKKVVLHFHASDLEDFYWNRCNEKKRTIVKNIFKLADKTISLNNIMNKLLKDTFNIDSSILYNFINIERKSIYNINSKNILMISRLTEDKGVYEAINVMKNLREYGLKLILAGDSTEIDFVKQYTKDNNLDDCIVFTGWVDDREKVKLFADCFVSILPSHFEGIPMSLLESLSYGVPVIASNVGGIPEIISENEGYIHEVNNESELEECILKLYKNNEIKSTLSKNCIDKCLSVFSEEHHVNRLIEIYKLSSNFNLLLEE